jgi:hypothetical protein
LPTIGHLFHWLPRTSPLSSEQLSTIVDNEKDVHWLAVQMLGRIPLQILPFSRNEARARDQAWTRDASRTLPMDHLPRMVDIKQRWCASRNAHRTRVGEQAQIVSLLVRGDVHDMLSNPPGALENRTSRALLGFVSRVIELHHFQHAERCWGIPFLQKCPRVAARAERSGE